MTWGAGGPAVALSESGAMALAAPLAQGYLEAIVRWILQGSAQNRPLSRAR